MTNKRAYLDQIRAAVVSAPAPARRFFLTAARRIVGHYDPEYNDVALLYGLDCNKQLVRTPFVPEFVDLMLGEHQQERDEFRDYLRFGRISERLPLRVLIKYRLGYLFTIDALGDLFDTTLEDEEDLFVYSYEPLLKELNAATEGSEAWLDIAPRSLALYRSYISEDVSEEMYEKWAQDKVYAVRRAIETWGFSHGH